jgi:uncharacterized protein with GYD domain
MPHYVMLVNLTQEGISGAKGGVDRYEANRKAFEAMGAKITSAYWTMGPYDMVVTCEAPDDETVSRIAVAYGMKGTGRSLTMRAFSPDEWRGVLGKLP